MLRLLSAAGVVCWVDGGWGIDALLGRQSREHDDLDLVIDDATLDAALAALAGAGFEVIRDWLPTAVALRRTGDGAQVDLHPVCRTADGGGDQVQRDGASTYHYSTPVRGRIGDTTVLCAPVEDQVTGHLGYEPADQDRRDMAALARQFAVDLPDPYGQA